MNIQYASDLHLELAANSRFLQDNPLSPVGDVLVLAGDIAYLNSPTYTEHPFWDWAAANYRQVIVAVGNHELYQFYDLKTMPQGEVCKIRDNVTCYYNARVSIENVDFVVSTLWAEIPPEQAYITQRNVSDFYRICYEGRLLQACGFNAEHKRCMAFIREQVAQSRAEHIVVVTHHVPSFALMADEFKGSRINGAFTSEQGDYIAASRIDYWLYGHSHRNIDLVIGQTRCVSNQLGYVSHAENRTFDPAKMFTLS